MAAEQYVFLKNLRAVYRAFKKEDGEYRLISGAQVGGVNLSELSERKINFLAKLLDFILKSNFLGEATLIWFESVQSNRNDALEDYNKLNDIPISKSVARGQWDNNKNALLKVFPDKLIRDVCSNRVSFNDDRIDIEEAERCLKRAMNKKHGITQLNEVSIFNLTTKTRKEKPSEYELERFFIIFSQYTKEMVKSMEDELPQNVVEYINYLNTQNRLSGEDQEILDRLNNLGKPEQPDPNEINVDDLIIE